jgi:hypothetical protein
VSTASPYSKQDQIIHRCYIKTVGVLVEGRLTHYGATAAKGEKRKDKWVGDLVHIHWPSAGMPIFARGVSC